MKTLTKIFSVMSAVALLAAFPISTSAKAKLSLKAENKDSGIKLSWNKTASTKKFTVLRKEGKKKFKTLKKLKGKFTFTDKTAKAGKKYTYKIVSGKTVSKKTLIRLKTPTITKLVSDEQGLHLTWKKIKGAKKYEIYSATTGKYKKIATVKTNALLDSSTKTEQTYKYKVRAVNGFSKSAFSKEKKWILTDNIPDNKEDETPEIKDYPVTYGDIPEDAVSIECTKKYRSGWDYPEYCITDEEHPDVTTVFNSFDEYKNYFEKTFDEFDEKFFETKSLIFIYRFEYHYSTHHSVDRVAVKDNVLYIQEIESNPKDLWEEALGNWNIFVAVDKSDIKNAEKLCISYEYEWY
ncbi:MAG: hypothetical protein J1E96_07220 [Ruminococcus sp.]|nr:hypothetical protein [Ruminococcus sp.]